MIERWAIRQRALDRYLVLALLCLFALAWVTPLAIVALSSMKTPREQAQSGILALPENAAMIFDNIASASECRASATDSLAVSFMHSSVP